MRPDKPTGPRSSAESIAPTATSTKTTKTSKTLKAQTAPRRGKPRAAPALTPQERHARVCQAAYYLAEMRGFAPGRELDDWYAAEAQVDTQLA
jgi:hypothetical protein